MLLNPASKILDIGSFQLLYRYKSSTSIIQLKPPTDVRGKPTDEIYQNHIYASRSQSYLVDLQTHLTLYKTCAHVWNLAS